MVCVLRSRHVRIAWRTEADGSVWRWNLYIIATASFGSFGVWKLRNAFSASTRTVACLSFNRSKINFTILSKCFTTRHTFSGSDSSNVVTKLHNRARTLCSVILKLIFYLEMESSKRMRIGTFNTQSKIAFKNSCIPSTSACEMDVAKLAINFSPTFTQFVGASSYEINSFKQRIKSSEKSLWPIWKIPTMKFS